MKSDVEDKRDPRRSLTPDGRLIVSGARLHHPLFIYPEGGSKNVVER